jgi:hypothetical protein
MNEVKCPYCEKIQKDEPVKSWSYGKIIKSHTKEKTTWGASVKCSQYTCKCGKSFKFYLTTNGKSWTIPKSNKLEK